MPTVRTVLIAEDNEVNRRILVHILSPEYRVLQAVNGLEALEMIEQHADVLSAVLLDLGMPVMDGYQVLEQLRGRPRFDNLPVIVATGSDDRNTEAHVLELGAWDFFPKPYDARILKFRLRNAIERSKLNLFDQLKYQAEHDALTGLYNLNKFCAEAQHMLHVNPGRQFVVLHFDIDRFKQYNSMFGTEEGDRLLCYLGDLMRSYATQNELVVYGRVEADVFALCTLHEEDNDYREALGRAQKAIRDYTSKFNLVTIFGVYFSQDTNEPVSEMLDCAATAAKTCKGGYQSTIAVYTEKMGAAIRAEQEIVNEMDAALAGRQFLVYYQPKYNLVTGMPCVAEALVRWRHPEKGLISPGAFIPVFEKNGFIAELDRYVWEQTCVDLRRWCDAGVDPDPVSVNISRVSLNNPHITDTITGLVQKYGILPRLLQLEITESAYMDDPSRMDDVVKAFHARGFTVLMDDFGSGYSSLNTLKDIAVDILKIDMKFLPSGDGNTRSEKILAAMIRMADWLDLPVVVEGVETQEQKDFLLSVGCTCVQGYYYARPMPAADYERLISADLQQKKHFDALADTAALDAFMSSDPKIEALLRGISVPVVIYSYDHDDFERIRANPAFLTIFGFREFSAGASTTIQPEERQKLCATFRQAVATQAAAECECLLATQNGAPRWYRLALKYLMPGRSGHILCAVYTEISQEKQIEREMAHILGVLNQSELSKRMMLVIDDNTVSRAMLKNLFESEFRVMEACNGQEGLDLLAVHRDEVAIVLLDMIMPGMDGTAFLGHKNHMEGVWDVPVVVISAEHDPHAQASMLRSGVNDYVTKPFVPEVVYRRVHNVLEYRSRFAGLVREFRQTLELSPFIGPRLISSVLTLSEARVLVAFMAPMFDVVRLVDPGDTAVITVDENDRIERHPYSCFRVWKKEARCANCSSACAAQGNCQTTKYEELDKDIYYVISRPLELLLPDDTSNKVVLEVVSRMADSPETGNLPLMGMQESTRRKIYCDPLTGAYNRRYLYEMLFWQNRPDKTDERVVFVMLDLNCFKAVNDNYGHAEGDRVLAEAARALQKQLRPADSLVRYGGDEFVVVLTSCPETQMPTIQQRLSDAVHTVTYGGDEKRRMSAKFGYACTEHFTPERVTLELLLKKADTAMYENRRAELKNQLQK